jgi:hypothetical protein
MKHCDKCGLWEGEWRACEGPDCGCLVESAPCRIQLSRKRGWRMPPNTVKVDRTTKWGNPFKPDLLYIAGPMPKRVPGLKQGGPIGVAGAVEAFRTLMRTNLRKEPEKTRALLEQLRGRNLACWCKVGEPCHADVLLRFANEPR